MYIDVFDIEHLELCICDYENATSHAVLAASFQYDRVSVEECCPLGENIFFAMILSLVKIPKPACRITWDHILKWNRWKTKPQDL